MERPTANEILTAKEFRKVWKLQNPKVIHIPSEHELGLMEQYAKYYHEQQVKNSPMPDAEQCLKIQEQVKQYCYTDQDDNPVISSGGIRTIISKWKQMAG